MAGLLSSILLAFPARAPAARSPRAASECWEVPSPRLRGEGARLALLLARAEEARREALGRLSEEVGLTPGRRPIHWRFIDRATVVKGSRSPPRRTAPESAGVPAPPRGSVPTFHAARTSVFPEAVVVEVAARRYLDRVEAVRAVVLHEAAHAVLASRLPSAAGYRAIPRWIREGFALEFSGEGRERLHARIATTLVARHAPDSFLIGVAEAGRDASPAECWLAATDVVATRGRARWRQLLLRSAGGEPPTRLLRELTGLAPRDLGRRLRQRARGRVRKELRPGGPERLWRALDLERAGRSADALLVWRRLAGGEGGPALVRTGRVFLARGLLASGRVSEAAAGLEALLERESEGLWEPEGLEALAHCRWRTGRRAEAAELWRQVLERFPEDGPVARRAREGLERARKAAPARAIDQQLPKHSTHHGSSEIQ